MKIPPIMNKIRQESYANVQQHIKGILPTKVQPPEY